MSFALCRLALIAAISVFCSSDVLAQSGREHDHLKEGTVSCGTQVMQSSTDRATVLENTRRANPELYARITSGKRATSGVMSAPMYDEYTFLVRNRVTNQLEEIQAALVYTGPFSRVWVDVRDTGKSSHKPTSATMRTLFKALDSAVDRTNITPRRSDQGILKNDIDVFGKIPEEFNVENRTDFLLLDIKDAVAGQNVLGYFSPTDQTKDDESNQMNLLYIDSREGFQNLQTLLGIIAHEFQHLIHYGRHPSTGSDAVQRDVAINEGMSEVASILNGYHFRANSAYLANTNVNFFEWHYSEANAQEIDYQRAMTFAHYLSEQFGERFLYELVGSPERNMARVDDALRKWGAPTGFDHTHVLANYAVANYLQSSSTPWFNYRYKLRGGSARPHLSHTGTSFPASGSAVLEGYGTYYVQYSSPGPMTFRYGGSTDLRVMMIGIRPSDTTVMPLQPDTDYTIPVWAGGPYTRFTVAFANTGGGKREANWTASALTAAIGDESAASGGLSLRSIASSDAGTAALVYTLPATGSVRLELFDARGLRVRAIEVDRSAGTHRDAFDVSDLPSGTYVARLLQNGRVASEVIPVTR